MASNAPFQKRCLEGGSRKTESNQVVLHWIVVPQTIVIRTGELADAAGRAETLRFAQDTLKIERNFTREIS
jgi:hypothetical protein